MNKSIQKVNILNGAHKSTAPISNNENHRNGTYIRVKQATNGSSNTAVQWTVKSLMDPKNSHGFSNINAWLSPKKMVDCKSSVANGSSNGLPQSHTSGYDMTKLYPELSSKLGLTKTGSEPTSHPCNKSKLQTCASVHSTVPEYIKLPIKKSVPKGNSFTIKNANGHIPTKIPNSPKANSKTKVCATRPIAKIQKLDHTELKKSRVTKTVKDEQLNQDAVYHSSLESSEIASDCAKKFSVVHIYPKKLLSFPKDEITSSSQIRVRTLYENNYAYFSDLFPFGFNTSDDNILSENLLATSSLPCRFSCKDESLSSPSNFSNPDEALGEVKQQVASAKGRLKYETSGPCELSLLTKALVEAAREDPSLAAKTVSHFTKKSPHLQSKKQNSSFQSSLLQHRTCVYEVFEGKLCEQDALPGTRHCIKHITYNVDQQLFSQCSARLEDNSYCRVPTFDVLHEPPLCDRHSDYVPTPVAQPTVEPKKARKKNKMPIVSRYGKRNKKRRRSSVTTVIPSTCVRPSMNSPGVCIGSPQSTSPLSPRPSPSFPKSVKVDDSGESEEELEVMDSSLSLDDAKLLDSKDLQEVFTRFAPSVFSQIFSGPETKEETSDGDFDESKIDSPHQAPDKEFACSSDSGIGADPSLETQNTHIPLALDNNVLGELATNGSIDSIISSSFNQQELNTISQVLSNMVHDDVLAQFPLSQNFDSDILKSDMIIDNAAYSEDTLMSDMRNQNDSIMEPISSVDCKISLVRQANKLQIDAPTLPPLQ